MCRELSDWNVEAKLLSYQRLPGPATVWDRHVPLPRRRRLRGPAVRRQLLGLSRPDLGQPEVVLEPDRQAGVVADPSHALQHARHEGLAVEGVVPDGRSLLPALPKSTSWWATSPRSRTEWTGMPSTRPPRAARPRRTG